MLQTYNHQHEIFPPALLPRADEIAGTGCFEWKRDHAEPLKPRVEESETHTFGRMLGKSAAMQTVFKLIAQVAPTNATVLVQGETGTGKELLARAIHEHSPRWQHPFIAVNYAALSENLLESELFGHERGAFTGALKQKPGRFELAHGGTLFLDEVGDIPLATQVKLLRVLQEKTFERVGGTATLRADFRIIAATNKDLKKAVQEDAFREDLYYRLNVVPLVLPPLRERREDIPLLARSFIESFAQAHNRKVAAMTPAAVEMLMRYSWPGNVRELENVMERAVVLCRGTQIELPELLFLMQEPEHKVLNLALQQRLQETDLTRLYAQLVLQEQHGNKKEACRVLGINYRTLQSRLGVDPHSEILTPGTRYHVSHQASL